MNKKYSWFGEHEKEELKFVIIHTENDMETFIARTDSAEKADFISKACNQFDYDKHDLNEAAERYASDTYDKNSSKPYHTTEYHLWRNKADNFKAGAQWQLEQKQMPTDEAIEQMAIDLFPIYPIYTMPAPEWKAYINECRNRWMQGFKSALQYAKPSAGVWVKASERLPEVNKQVCGKLKGKPAIVWNSSLIDGYITANGNLERIEDVEWLDKSALQYSVGDEALKESFDAGYDFRSSLLPEVIAEFGEGSMSDFDQWLATYKQIKTKWTS